MSSRMFALTEVLDERIRGTWLWAWAMAANAAGEKDGSRSREFMKFIAACVAEVPSLGRAC